MIAQGIVSTARSLGMRPIDLATIISYETGGTFDPKKKGPTTQWGQHRGLIQFGEPQAREYGVDWQNPVGSQLGPDGAVAKYFRAHGWKPGMGLLNAYSIVNAGAPGKFNASDAGNGGAPGTVRDKVEMQMGGHMQKAAKLLGGAFPPMAGNRAGVPTRDMPSLADFAAQRRQQAAMGQAPSLADFAASRKPAATQPAPAGDAFNMNPVTKHQTLTLADAPKVDTATALGAGVVRGLADLPAGLNELNEKVAAFNPLTLAADRMTGGIAGKIRKASADAIRGWDAGYEADYQAKYGDSGTAQLGRVGGNVATAFIPGAGEVKAMQGIGNLVKAGKTAQAMGAGAGLGAMQSAVLSGGDPADTVAGATLGGLLPGIAKMLPMMPEAQAGKLLSQGITDVPTRGLMDKGIPRAAVAAATHGMSEGKRVIDDLVRSRVQGNLNLAKDDPQKMLDLLAAYNKVATRRGGAVRAGLPLVPAVQGVRQ